MKASKVKNKAANSHPKTDRRVTQTRDALGDALVALMHEKQFDDITVQEVLDRAGIGRTTFYTHYRDKGDLLLSDAEDFLEHCLSALKRRKRNLRRTVPMVTIRHGPKNASVTMPGSRSCSRMKKPSATKTMLMASSAQSLTPGLGYGFLG